MKWFNETIKTIEGTKQAISPFIISASRSTDIPAFYSDWFMNRLQAGYVKWINPFNHKPQYISFSKTKVIVFWSKNPAPLIKYLQEIENRGIAYYFQFTINDYETEGYEPHVPPLNERIQIFKDLSLKIGKEKVIWRFDPLILTREISIDKLLHKIQHVGSELYPYTEKLVTSFADIGIYDKVQRNLKAAKVDYKEFQDETITEIAKGITELNKQWGLQISTCGERFALESFGISHNKCIDDDLILRILPNDKELLSFLGYLPEKQSDMFSNCEKVTKKSLKDTGQRAECGCIVSKDIGQYNTCAHLCVYCYANYSPHVVRKNRERINNKSESIIPD